MVKMSCKYILIFLFCSVFLKIVICDSTLRQIHVLFRHGNRTPSKHNTYPKDPYMNETWYPYGKGHLTNKGKVKAFNLGQHLRIFYDEFLGHIYHPDKVYARSTNYPRTQMTLQLVQAALWPPTPVQQWNGNTWQPTSYEQVPYEADKLLGFPISHCPELEEEYKKISSVKEVQDFLKDNSVVIKKINEATGLNITTTLELLELYLGLLAVKEEKDLPAWSTSNMNFLEMAANVEYKIQTTDDILVKATAGPLVKKVIDDIDEAVKTNAFSRKLFLYSAHEYNIAYMLGALSIFEPHVPPFCSAVIFELHNIDNQYGIKVFYLSKLEDEKPREMVIPGCEGFCQFNKFKNITMHIIPEHEWC